MISDAADPEDAREREFLRLAVLESYQVLDTAPEDIFDDIVIIAAEVCGVPMALISLVDDKRQWFKAALGLAATETPREIAFCAHAIQQTDLFLVEDAAKDARFSLNPLVTGDPNLRFYAGIPLIAPEGLALGTLCVLDTRPCTLTDAQQGALKALARQAMRQLDMRKALAVKDAGEVRDRMTVSRLLNAQEAGGVGIFEIDLATNRLTGTREFWRAFGLEESESRPATVINSLVLEDDAHKISTVETRELGTASLEVEYRIRRADSGEIRWISRRAEYELDANGERLRLVGVVRDITERKLAQEVADLNAAQFHTFAQTLPNHVWTAPPSGLLDWFNDRVYEYSGLSLGELDGSRWTQIVHENDLAEAGARWAAAVASGDSYEAEFRLRRYDGIYLWYLARAIAIRSAEGAIVRWVGTNTDINERKSAEVQRTHERDRTWALSQELMLVCDLQGLISTVNPAATRMLGFDIEEMIGHPIGEFIHPGDMAQTAAELTKLSKGSVTLSFENRYRCKDGSYRVLDWAAVPEEGYIHAVARDVTQERATEDALRQAQKMEAVGQLTGGIAHDFNNLLQGITGSLELVQKRIAQGRIGELDRFVAGAMNSARRASGLTQRLLAFSRRQPLDAQAVQVNQLVASMEDMLRRSMGERLRLEFVLAAGLWLTKCDANQLESAILNLAINARDAMPEGGTLTIETANTHLDRGYAAQHLDLKPGQYVCVGVTDTGSGMSAATIAQAFEPFFTTKPTGQGTGLGLSMIYGFAKQSSGHAKIYSEIGKGTTVRLYLPRHRGELEIEETLPQLSGSHNAGAHETVLVVEDEPVVRGLIVETLQELGYSALEASDGPSGLELLQSQRRIDLLITDVGLPILNGRQLAEAARALRPALKVLFMTGYAENAAIGSGLLDDGVTLISKPFAMEALATQLRTILEGP